MQTLSPVRLVAAAALALVSYGLYASFDLVGRRLTGHALSTPRTMTIAAISYAFGLNFGSWIGGIELRLWLYTRWGLSASTVGRIVAHSVVTNWLGYLIEQFLNPIVNLRTDGHGGSIEGRNRLALEIARATVASIGRDRVGIRLSPYGVFNGTGEFPEVQAQYKALAKSLSALGLLYIHLVDHSSMGAPPVPADFKLKLRAAFDHASAEQALLDKRGDLIAFGRPFLANPDLVARMGKDAPINAPDMATFYVPGTKGYTDYPTLPA